MKVWIGIKLGAIALINYALFMLPRTNLFNTKSIKTITQKYLIFYKFVPYLSAIL